MNMYRLYSFSLPWCQELDPSRCCRAASQVLLIKFRRPEVFKVRENISVALFSVRYKLTVIRLCRFVYLFCLFVAGGGALLLQDDVTADFLAHFSSVLSRLLRISSCFHLHFSPYFSM